MNSRLTSTSLLGIFVLAAVCFLADGPDSAGLVAKYDFAEGSGGRVADTSGNHNDGTVVGSAQWTDGVHGKALVFDGMNRVSVPHSASLNLANSATVVAWVRGQGSKFRMVREPGSYSSMRGPFFQVVGDKIYFATNSDHATSENPKLAENPDMKKHPQFPWNDWHIWTGSGDINLTNWHDMQRTKFPFSGIEPKLQVVNDHVYYEYFGQDQNRAWQIWTAESKTDGSDWKTTQRTFEKSGYRTEQEANHQVADGKIYYGWMEKDAKNKWQLWTAISNIDGSHFQATQRTTQGGGIPNVQVAGDTVYYLYPKRYDVSDAAHKRFRETLFFATSDKSGNNWHVIHSVENVMAEGWRAFQVSKGKIYFSYGALDEKNLMRLYTGSMNTDGSNFKTTPRTSGPELAGVGNCNSGSLQVVGNKVYYSFMEESGDSSAEEHLAWKDTEYAKRTGDMGITMWTGSANLDGSNWKAVQRTTAPPDTEPGYKGIGIVGGKSYYGAMEELTYPDGKHTDRFHAVMATSGSNIVNKGDAYGIGLTEFNEARAFVNAGPDYLFRGQAPEDTGGAAADFLIDETWHQLAMTYDQSAVKLYVDGEAKASFPLQQKIGSNPFPLIVGDGFKGAISQVRIYNRTLNNDEVAALYRKSK
jgi:hypothetical protein